MEFSDFVNHIASLDDDLLPTVLLTMRADIAQQRAEKDSEPGVLAACEKFIGEAEKQWNIRRDYRFAQSISDARLNDQAMIDIISAEETRAQEDRVIARRLAESDGELVAADAVPPYQEPALQPSCDTLARLAGLYHGHEAGIRFKQAEKESFDVTINIQEQQQRCIICAEMRSCFEVMPLPCGDLWCRECIRTIFESATRDESLFPPRCCRTHISVENVDIFMTGEMKKLFAKKKIEFETVDRLYCANSSCSAFLPPMQTQGRHRRCDDCGSMTCIECKGSAHQDACPEDEDVQIVLKIAQDEGWQRCSSCKTMVELNTGCYHMTCRCGYEFCYLCGRGPWKGCECPQWDEVRLVERAVQRVGERGEQEDAAYDARLVAAIARIEEAHDCQHDSGWSLRGGSHRCMLCEATFGRYILECRICDFQICVPCQRTRLR